MSRTLTEMRGDIRSLLDEASSVRWSDSEINLAIIRAVHTVSAALVSDGPDYILKNQADISVVNGVATVPAHFDIKNVFITNDNNFYRVSRASASGRNQVDTGLVGPIAIDYIAKQSSFGDSDTITYCGVNVDNAICDQYCAYLAASDLKTKDGEVNVNITRKLQELENTLQLQYGGSFHARSNKRDKFHPYLRYFISSPTTITFFR